MSNFKKLLLSAACFAVLTPASALACACGCGVFDVGTGTMMPSEEGGKAWLEYDFMNQNRNWSGSSTGNRSDNEDKMLRSQFITAGVQYMFSRDWGAELNVPYIARDFKKTTDFPNPDDTQTFNHTGFGDVRLKGIYTGFSEDMSTGVTFGLKLPTGDFSYSNFDRDTSLGSGSTNWLLGAFHQGSLSEKAPYNWFVNGQWDHAFLTQDHYRPGDEFDGALGVYYDGFDFGKIGKIVPIAQMIGSVRIHDTGSNADPDNSGYQRLLLSPGVEYDVGNVSLYGDIELPVYQYVNGNQLVAPVYVKFVAGYKF